MQTRKIFKSVVEKYNLFAALQTKILDFKWLLAKWRKAKWLMAFFVNIFAVNICNHNGI